MDFDELFCFLVDCFPEVDHELLTRAALESNGTKEDALDVVLSLCHLQNGGNDSKVEPTIKCSEEEEYSQMVYSLHAAFPKIDIAILNSVVFANPEEELPALISYIVFEVESVQLQAVKKKRQFVPLSPNVLGIGSFRSQGKERSLLARFEETIREQCKIEFKVHPNPQELRDAVQELQVKRFYNLEQSVQAYRQGGATGRGKAIYFSNEAANLKPEIDRLNWTAAYSFLLRM